MRQDTHPAPAGADLARRGKTAASKAARSAYPSQHGNDFGRGRARARRARFAAVDTADSGPTINRYAVRGKGSTSHSVRTKSNRLPAKTKKAVPSPRPNCPSSLIYIHPTQLSGVGAYSDGEAGRPAEMRRPPRLLGVRRDQQLPASANSF